jgi:hypothetical protein
MSQALAIRMLSTVTMVALVPALASAQSMAAPVATFGNLPDRVKIGNVVIVHDPSGAIVTGKVTAVSPTALSIATRNDAGGSGGRWSGGSKTFTPTDVSHIGRTGPIWDGAIKGFAVPAAVILGVKINGCYDCQLDQYLLVTGLIGAGIGVAVDSAFGPKTVYRAPSGSPRSKRTIAVAPFMTPGRRAVMAVIGF